MGVLSVVVDSVVVSVSVVVDSGADSVVVSDSVDVVPGSVVDSVDVGSESTASGPAPATTPAATSPAVNSVTSMNAIRRRCRPREAAAPPDVIFPTPLCVAASGVPTPHSLYRAALTRSQRLGVASSLPVRLGVRCYNPPPADGESALFL